MQFKGSKMCYYINAGGQSFKIKYMIKIYCTFDKILTFPPPGFVKHFEASIATTKLWKKLLDNTKSKPFLFIVLASNKCTYCQFESEMLISDQCF